MDGMILAAGKGTRLGSLTASLPKALMPVGSRTLLDRVMERFVEAGVTTIVINLHHFAPRIRAHCQRHPPSGATLRFSEEPDGPYDTGGGLLHAAPLFQTTGPILLHNVDVLSTVPLAELVVRHTHAGAGAQALGPIDAGDRGSRPQGPTGPIASLAVQRRDARRALLFDDGGLLGWENVGSDRSPEGRRVVRESHGPVHRLAFTGIHVLDPVALELCQRSGTFSIIDLYLDLAREGWRIQPLDVTEHDWLDVGTPERLEEARRRYS